MYLHTIVHVHVDTISIHCTLIRDTGTSIVCTCWKTYMYIAVSMHNYSTGITLIYMYMYMYMYVKFFTSW